MIACCPFCGAEYFPSNARCHDCHLGLDPPPPATLPEDQPQEELVYELAEWPVHARVKLTATLGERAIAYRWEPGPDLVIRDHDGDAVDELLDALEAAEVEPDDGDAEEEEGDDEEEWSEDDEEQAATEGVAQAAMADLFVAADRLMHEPGDPGVADDLVEAAVLVDDNPAPFGIEPRTWAKVRELATAVRDDLRSDADEEAVALDAQALREALRPFV